MSRSLWPQEPDSETSLIRPYSLTDGRTRPSRSDLPLAAQVVAVPAVEEPQVDTELREILTSVLVDDQERALRFHTEVLGFLGKHDVPMSGPRWSSAAPPEASRVRAAARARRVSGCGAVQGGSDGRQVPYASSPVADARNEYERLRELDVRFTQEPADTGAVTTAVLDETCGNLVQIVQHHG